jgi:hypothetical protein
VLVDAVDERPVEVEQEGLCSIHADMLRACRVCGRRSWAMVPQAFGRCYTPPVS